MKLKIYRKTKSWLRAASILPVCMLLLNTVLLGQDDSTAVTEKSAPAKTKPVKNTFQSIWISDNQTVMVPVKKTLEMDIMHRFGTWNKGYEDFWGFFAPSNIRIGINYVPINKLNVGIGFTKTTAAIIPQAGISSVSGPLWDGNLKYSIITQTKGKYPVSVSYYVNASYNTKKDLNKEIYRYWSDRISYFHQILIARKVTDKLSVQVAPSLSHHNAVNGYYTKLNDSTLQINRSMEFEHFAVAFSARYKLTEVTSVMVNYDQPITKHATKNPNPSLSFGVEMNTSSHSFQLFFTNFYYLNPAANNMYNSNNPFTHTDKSITDDPATAINESKVKGGRFLIGFNITRLWNY
ncbi:MAG TPA: DUF5777 family beta-barrel protein [Chitinophagaceae bacterium]|nr:DUF5777 family beta-barrel protein [Chitinophagaceae bacterium]